MDTKAKAYVDTSALIAFLDRSDTYHPLFNRLFSSPPPLITTPLVIAEGHGWFLRRYDIHRALQFLNFIEDFKPLKVIPLSKAEQAPTFNIIRKFSDQKLTIADAMGLYVMGQQKIKTCWSTDKHLSLTGVSLIIHDVDG